ncbi:ferredoxin-nitrite reductase [Galdieria sulphuraria]|uniref:Ferredoxin--nitrite reductase, chloroplastic n=1 Tax=Galdieria sulphuraria TaxID=130081 RepID=M2XD40_GALSU|nr:ferredoxin-nitrite reductase [Galdieria sulphuraria]EME27862.1 ferredoxin-nitrite reductase [Galdieria sulphuraria]|eukprot:XP_005704382.1 ferredoxin-nitrite reductase [Galdieria sulphuraria]
MHCRSLCYVRTNALSVRRLNETTASADSAPLEDSLPSFDLPLITGWDFLPKTIQQSVLENNNKIEKLKAEKDGSLAWQEIQKYSQMLRDGNVNWEDIPPEDLDIRLKWAGFFHRRKRVPGTFMVRLRLPNGIIWGYQLKALCSFLRRYDLQNTCFDITTRQNLQLRGIRLEDAGIFLEELTRLGIGCFQSGMDNVRNIVGSPLAGIDPYELYDTRSICFALDEMISNGGKGKPDFANLPRKFNIAVGSYSVDTVHGHINDLAFLPIAKDDSSGSLLFEILIGGLLSPKRNETSLRLNLWVPESSILAVTRVVLEIYRDFGFRNSRATSRFIYLIESWGLERIKAEIVRRLEEKDVVWLEPLKNSIADNSAPVIGSEIFGIHLQRQKDKFFLSCHVPVGRLNVQEAEVLADIASNYSCGEIRLTVDQNFILPNIVRTKIESVLQEPLLRERFTHRPRPLSKGLVSCTGSQFCGLALIETKNRSLELCKILEETLDFPDGQTVRIHWTGCPNSCGQAQVADIGLMGAPAKQDGKLVEGVDIYLGGTLGVNSTLGTLYRKGIPCDFKYLLPIMIELLQTHFGARLKEDM